MLICFSGHGGRIESGARSSEYLLPVDTRFATAELLAQTSVAGDEFAAAIQALPAQRVVVILDCYHAAGIGYLKDASEPVLKTGLPDVYFDTLKQGRGRVILASPRSSESSYVIPKARNSLFTQHLLAGMKGGVASEDGYRFDAYVSYVNMAPDATWVWGTLAPQLEAAGLRVAVSGDVEDPGVARVVNIERGIRDARRTIVVLSAHYLADNMASFENVLAQTMSIQEGRYRLLPIQIEAIDPDRLPVRLSMLTTLNLTHSQRAQREFSRLIEALKKPLSAKGTNH